MPKKPKPAEGSAPPIRAQGPDGKPPAGSKLVGSDEALAILRSTGTGWSEDIADLLSAPPDLHMLRTDSGTYFSDGPVFAITGLPEALAFGDVSKLRGFGLALYSTGGSVYFMLMDMGRGIIVREKIFSIHDSPPEKDWAKVKSLILGSLEAAGEARKEGYVVVCDPLMRRMKAPR